MMRPAIGSVVTPRQDDGSRHRILSEWLSKPRPALTFSGWRERMCNIYRAHVRPCARFDVERYAFVEAWSKDVARTKTAQALAIVEDRNVHQVEHEITGVVSALECIEFGVSEDLDLRLFETRWNGGAVTAFVSHPVFLLAAHATLIRKWALVAGVTRA